MTGISIKEANKLADAIDEVYQQRDMADKILEEIYQIYYGGKMFNKNLLPKTIREDYKKAREFDDIMEHVKTYGEYYLMDDMPHVNYGIRQKHQENQEIVNRLNERLEQCKTFMEPHNDDFNYFYDLEKELEKIRGRKK